MKHADYAAKSVQELLPLESLNKAIGRKFDYAASCVAINKGNGEFEVHELPAMVQLSSMNAIQCIDVNHDGYTDIVSGGNQFDFIPQLERLDASSGDILINDGKGNFTRMESAQTGLNLRGELREIAELKTKDKTYLLFLQNDEYPLLYQLKNSSEKRISTFRSSK